MTNRKIKDLPKHFQKNKVEISRAIRTYWSNKLNENGQKNETTNNIALLYIQLEELQSYIETEFCNLGSMLLEKMHEENMNKVILGEFGEVLEYDDEAKWIYRRNLNDSEWKEYDDACNKKYLESIKNV